MKRYIRAAVEYIGTLCDWIINPTENISDDTHMVIVRDDNGNLIANDELYSDVRNKFTTMHNPALEDLIITNCYFVPRDNVCILIVTPSLDWVR